MMAEGQVDGTSAAGWSFDVTSAACSQPLVTRRELRKPISLCVEVELIAQTNPSRRTFASPPTAVRTL